MPQLDDAYIDELLRECATHSGAVLDAAQDCPPFPLLERLARSNAWPAELASHVRSCRLCRRALVIHYEYEHVRWSDLERYVDDSESISLVASAISEHVNICARCSAKLLAIKFGIRVSVPVDLRTAALSFRPEAETEQTAPTVEIVEKQIRVTLINSGGEYTAHVDATSPISAATLVVAEADSTEREFEVELQELDLIDTPYRWYGAKSLGSLDPARSVDQAWAVKAYILPQKQA
jgi:hypothetical protein